MSTGIKAGLPQPSWAEAAASWPNLAIPSTEVCEMLTTAVDPNYGAIIYCQPLATEDAGKPRTFAATQFYWMVFKQGKKKLESIIEKHYYDLSVVNVDGRKVTFQYNEKGKPKTAEMEAKDDAHARAIVAVALTSHAILRVDWPIDDCLRSSLMVTGSRLQLQAEHIPPLGGYAICYAGLLTQLGLPCPHTNDMEAHVAHDRAPDSRYRRSMAPHGENILYLNSLPGILDKKDKLKATPATLQAAMTALRYNTWVKGVHFHSLAAPEFPTQLAGVMVKDNTSLTHIILEDVHFSPSALLTLAKSFETTKCNLTVVSFRNTPLGGASGVKAITKGLFKHRLQFLSLAGADITAKLLSEVFQGLSGSLGTLHTLDLSDNELGTPGTTTLTSWLPNATALRKLYLASCGIDLNSFFKAVTGLPIESFDLSGHPIVPKQYPNLKGMVLAMTGLRYLGLRSSKIGGLGITNVLTALNETPARQQLTLDCSDTTVGSDMASVFEFLAVNQCLALEGLILRETHFKSASIIPFSSLLSSLPNLTTLDLGHNMKQSHKEGDEAIQALAGAVSTMHITTFHMSGCEGAQLGSLTPALVRGLVNSNVVALNVSNNRGGVEVYNEVTSLLGNNMCMASVRCDGNGTTMEALERLVGAVENNTAITQIEMSLDMSNMIAQNKAKAKKKDWSAALQSLLTRLNRTLSANAVSAAAAGGTNLDDVNFSPTSMVLDILADLNDDAPQPGTPSMQRAHTASASAGNSSGGMSGGALGAGAAAALDDSTERAVANFFTPDETDAVTTWATRGDGANAARDALLGVYARMAGVEVSALTAGPTGTPTMPPAPPLTPQKLPPPPVIGGGTPSPQDVPPPPAVLPPPPIVGDLPPPPVLGGPPPLPAKNKAPGPAPELVAPPPPGNLPPPPMVLSAPPPPSNLPPPPVI